MKNNDKKNIFSRNSSLKLFLISKSTIEIYKIYLPYLNSDKFLFFPSPFKIFALPLNGNSNC